MKRIFIVCAASMFLYASPVTAAGPIGAAVGGAAVEVVTDIAGKVIEGTINNSSKKSGGTGGTQQGITNQTNIEKSTIQATGKGSKIDIGKVQNRGGTQNQVTNIMESKDSHFYATGGGVLGVGGVENNTGTQTNVTNITTITGSTLRADDKSELSVGQVVND